MRHFLLALLAFVAGCFSGHAADYRVSSPSGNIVLTVSNGDKLSYSVTWNGRTAIAPSAMGFEFKGEKPMAGPFTVLGNPCVEAHVEAWKPVVANKYSDISVASKSLTLQLKETADEGRRMDLEFRVMDDGVAFRYTLYPVTRVGDRMVQRELTEFAVPAGTEGWMTEYPRPFRSSQEAWRTRTPLASVPDSQITGLPLLLKADDDLYLAITEAAMDNWSGFYLGVGKTAGGVCTLETHLSPLPWEEPESWANLKKYEEGVKVRFDDVIRSSWRLVMIVDNPGRFIESEAIHSLNGPCAIEDPS
jgi:alpha-glucosidase